jgi:hypothetical protein
MKKDNTLYSDTSDSFRNKTLQEYKNNYSELIMYYKEQNEDNDEFTFVFSEINLIKNYIKPVVENEMTELEKKDVYDLRNGMIKKYLASYLKIISFLESKKREIILPTQNKTSNNDEVKKELHNHIFKNNAFEVWHSMFESFDIKESSRTDIRFMYDAMQFDGLIHENISQTYLLGWITEIYQITIEKPQYKDFKKDTKRNAIYNTAKTIYNN